MVRKRLLTVLTFSDGVLFRTKDFNPDYRYTHSFVDTWSIDEIVLLDVTRPNQGKKENFYEVVSEVARKCFVPLCVGGGVSSVADFDRLLKLGADKISVNTGALLNPGMISEAAKQYGSQCVVASIDAKLGANGEYEVYSHCGTKAAGLSAVQWAKQCQELGAGEILLCAMDRDGALEGYDNRLNSEVSAAVSIPVLVVGGAGSWQHFVDGFTLGGASGVCTSCIYHFTETSIRSAKSFLIKAGIEVRP
jgi:imidazole glycerol-phosphate synthase subunit HisF